MNRAQRTVLIAALILIVLMVLFPPWHVMFLGTDQALGYAWLFSPPTTHLPTDIIRIDMLYLTGQIVVVLAITGLVWLLLGKARP